jgi:hypothetical protein
MRPRVNLKPPAFMGLATFLASASSAESKTLFHKLLIYEAVSAIPRQNDL